MTESRPDRADFVFEVYLQHIAQTAELLGAPHDPELCRRVVIAFGPSFSNQVLQWKTTDRPGDGLYYRFLSTDTFDCVERAQQHGLIQSRLEPLLNLQREALEHFPQAVRSGADFEASRGLAKVWTFTSPIFLNQLLELQSVPESLRLNQPKLERMGLNTVGFLASDFLSESMNVYFPWHHHQRDRAWLEQMQECFPGCGPPADLVLEMIDSQDEISGLGMTFDWRRPEPLRWCIYCFAVPFGQSRPQVRLPRLSPRLQTLVDRAPTLNERPVYHLAWSFGPAGPYQKLEKNYAGDVDHFLATERRLRFRVPELESDLAEVEKNLETVATTRGGSLTETSRSVLLDGGKRLRPALVLLVGRMFLKRSAELVAVATAIEMVHAASLLHDDLIDQASTRRGKPTLHRSHGARYSVLLGDFLLCQALLVVAELGRVELLQALSGAVAEMTEGQILEARQQGDTSTRIEDYLRVLEGKTAALMAASCAMAAMVCGADQDQVQAAARFGKELGLAFQIVDDVLDFWGDPEVMGKPIGSDLRDQKFTLPFLDTFQRAAPEEQCWANHMVSKGNLNHGGLEEIIDWMESYGARERSLATARKHTEAARAALNALPEGPPRFSLGRLLEGGIQRTH